MKYSSFSPIMLIHLATLSIFFIPQIQCTIPKTRLVDQICRKTPHYHLCVLTLNSHLQYSQHRRSSVDIASCARTTIEIVAANASATLQHVHKVYMQTNDPQEKNALASCTASYTKIVKVLLPEAITCMDKGDYKGVKQGVFIAGNLALSCEKKCKDTNTSSLKDSNRYVENLCAVAVSIVTKLAQTKPQTLA
ncbi:uncharacterized protein LOC133295545 [Gastrolobium bilobum]|uniref:uncharacterized protein LOC133295545 n=1 Tax=Gastrolobium bilobum TaxID=150636 RepID=UPI002AAFA7E8|nr:uncharacterized protein LOC133295545 [Gastrolobium bilobum]